MRTVALFLHISEYSGANIYDITLIHVNSLVVHIRPHAVLFFYEE